MGIIVEGVLQESRLKAVEAKLNQDVNRNNSAGG